MYEKLTKNALKCMYIATGITMMITYLSYLYERHENTMTVLESYSGNRTYEGTLRYYNRVVSWTGKDIQ